VKPGEARGQPGDLGHPIVIQSTPDRLEQTMRAERVNGWGQWGASVAGPAIEVQQSRQFGPGRSACQSRGGYGLPVPDQHGLTRLEGSDEASNTMTNGRSAPAFLASGQFRCQGQDNRLKFPSLFDFHTGYILSQCQETIGSHSEAQKR